MKFLLFFLLLFSQFNLVRAATPQNTPASTPIRPIPEEEQQSAFAQADQTDQTPKPPSQTLAQPAYKGTAEDTSQPATGGTPPESGTDINNIKKKKKNKNKYKKEKKEDRKKKSKDRKKEKKEKKDRKNQQKKQCAKERVEKKKARKNQRKL